MERDEEGTHHRLMERFEVLARSVDYHEGKIAHFAGDAVLMEFRGLGNALYCALNIQERIELMNAPLQEDCRVRFRVGINFGEVIADRGDIYGNAVNLAVRLQALALPGGICVSESFRCCSDGHLPIDYVSLGKQSMKNISAPVVAYHLRRRCADSKSQLGDAQVVPAIAFEGSTKRRAEFRGAA